MSMQSVLSSKNTFQRAETRQTFWNSLLEVILKWQRQAQSRRELARLSPLDVKDIGYPAGVEAEKHKPFWRS